MDQIDKDKEKEMRTMWGMYKLRIFTWDEWRELYRRIYEMGR